MSKSIRRILMSSLVIFASLSSASVAQAGIFDHLNLFGRKKQERPLRSRISPYQHPTYGYHATRWRRFPGAMYPQEAFGTSGYGTIDYYRSSPYGTPVYGDMGAPMQYGGTPAGMVPSMPSASPPLSTSPSPLSPITDPIVPQPAAPPLPSSGRKTYEQDQDILDGLRNPFPPVETAPGSTSEPSTLQVTPPKPVEAHSASFHRIHGAPTVKLPLVQPQVRAGR